MFFEYWFTLVSLIKFLKYQATRATATVRIDKLRSLKTNKKLCKETKPKHSEYVLQKRRGICCHFEWY